MKMPTATMERAFAARDTGFDGLFYVGVVSTGIFCRPSCPARRPKRGNTRYFDSTRDAEAAGFRACKRCKPLEANGALPIWARTLLDRLAERPCQRIDDSDLAAIGLDPVQVRRFFQRRFGMTFHQYERSSRMNRASAALGEQGVEDVGFRNGYESSSGFRQAFRNLFGKPPSKIAESDVIVASWLESPVGPLVLGASNEGLCFLEFSEPIRLGTQLAGLRRQLQRAIVPGQHAHLEMAAAELREYFDGSLRQFKTPLHLKGTAFQMAVWKGLLEIPYAATVSYERLARQIGQPGKQRAVGRANGQNRLAIIVPCHRVVNKNGALGGYGGGLWRKQKLLDLERDNNVVE